MNSACLAWARSPAVTASRTMASVASQAGDWRPHGETRSGNRQVAVVGQRHLKGQFDLDCHGGRTTEGVFTPIVPAPSGHSRVHLAQLATAEPAKRSLTAYDN